MYIPVTRRYCTLWVRIQKQKMSYYAEYHVKQSVLSYCSWRQNSSGIASTQSFGRTSVFCFSVESAGVGHQQYVMTSHLTKPARVTAECSHNPTPQSHHRRGICNTQAHTRAHTHTHTHKTLDPIQLHRCFGTPAAT